MAGKQNGSIGEPINGGSGIATPIEGSSSNGSINPQPAPGNGSNGIGDVIEGFESYDPRSAAGTDSGAGASGSAKRRGRPPGSRNTSRAGAAPTAQTKAQDLGNIETLLLSVHSAIAGFLETPELELDGSEATKLAGAMQRVADQYPVRITPKLMAWLNLSFVAGGIYGSRYAAIKVRLKMEAEKQGPKSPAPIAIVPAPAPDTKQAGKTESRQPQPVPPGRITNPSQMFGLDFSAANIE